MLNIKTTKSLKMYSRMGTESRSIQPIFEIVLVNESIRTEHKLPFALMIANCFMNGAYPPGFRRLNSEAIGKFIRDRNSDSVYCSPKKAKLCLLDPSNSEILEFTYKCTKPGTLIRWLHAIEIVNTGLHLTDNFSTNITSKYFELHKETLKT